MWNEERERESNNNNNDNKSFISNKLHWVFYNGICNYIGFYIDYIGFKIMDTISVSDLLSLKYLQERVKFYIKNNIYSV